jgi:4-hydroxythreonine-4-phosphate dehydrogenase
MTPAPAASAGGLKPLVLTMGEPAGIGGEITLKAWLGRDQDFPPFVALDDPARLDALARGLGLEVPVRTIENLDLAASVFATALPVLPRPLEVEVVPGKPATGNAGAVIGSIETAVSLVRSGHARAVVTNPIHKGALYEAGFNYPGHTEFLADLAGIDSRPVMMLACDELKVVPISVHESLAAAVRGLKQEDIVTAGEITAFALSRDFAIGRPRLAVAGLNPHAGEGGAMGREEIDIIGPAIARLSEGGVDAFGPVSPDSLFTADARASYDVALCMYHDQALIPIKTLDFDGAVNVTLGLPFVRTSPDHGTGLDIAGRGRARPSSLIAALKLADRMAECRDAGA